MKKGVFYLIMVMLLGVTVLTATSCAEYTCPTYSRMPRIKPHLTKYHKEMGQRPVNLTVSRSRY